MDIWRASHEQIKATAKYIYGIDAARDTDEFRSVYKPSGLWADVTLVNGERVSVSDWQIDLYLQSVSPKS
jgi:hypothetical protein